MALLLLAAMVVGAIGLRRFVHEPIPTKTASARPSIFCEFYDFMHKGVVASFDFGVDERGSSAPTLRTLVLPDGSETNYVRDERPRWSYTVEDQTPTLTAPDGETRILLYGFNPRQGGIIWLEAGVRSTSTRNLEGRCRQAFLNRSMLGAVASGTALGDGKR